MLTPGETMLVETYLATAIQADLNPRQTVRLIFPVGTGPTLTELPYNETPQAYAAWVVAYCLGQRWPSPPAVSMMETLLAWLVNTKLVGALAAPLQRVKDRIDPNPDPYEAQWLLADLPFFDRDTLRPLVRSFIQMPDRPFLCVKGDDAYGRTYTSEYFDYLREKVPGLRVVFEDLPAGNAATYTVLDLVRKLTGPMAFQETIPTGNGSSSSGAELCRWFIPIALRQPARWVFVLDGFGQRDIQPPVKEFISCFANGIRKGEERQRLRLVLLGCDILDPQQLRVTHVESLQPACNISQQHLVSCLAELNARRQSLGKPPLADLVTLAAGMLAAAPPNGKARLESLNDQLSALRDWTGTPSASTATGGPS